MVVNRFVRRMLDAVAASTGDALVEANVGSAAVVPMDVPAAEYGGTTFEESSPQNPRATQLSTRMWRDRRVTLKLCAGALFCLACVAAVTAAVHMHPANESIVAHSGELPKDAPTKVPDRGSLTGGATSREAGVRQSVALPAGSAPTAAKAVSAPGPEEASPVNTTALGPSLGPLGSTAEAAPGEDRETIRVTAIPAPTASPTEAAPISTAGPPSGRPTPSSTISVPGSPPAQLRIPTAEISALVARGDALFALGDISSARLFYERAVDAGEARAAIRLGNTFDQAFLDFAHLRIRGDSASAESWYGRARDLGAAEAEILLQRLKPLSSR